MTKQFKYLAVNLYLGYNSIPMKHEYVVQVYEHDGLNLTLLQEIRHSHFYPYQAENKLKFSDDGQFLFLSTFHTN